MNKIVVANQKVSQICKFFIQKTHHKKLDLGY